MCGEQKRKISSLVLQTITHMKLLLTILLLLSFAGVHSRTITPEQAKDSIGKQVNVCGDVTGTHSTEKVTLLNIGGKYPNNAFTVVVFAANNLNSLINYPF